MSHRLNAVGQLHQHFVEHADGDAAAAALDRAAPRKGRVMTMAYHEVPPEILEQPMELVVWARKAIQLAAAKPKKPKKPRP
ncbi:MAG TPA: hypothetical protein VGI63_03240 [Verrucomicrobiae bacterium]